MVGFDLPHVAHDMILRFMKVDFSVINSHKASTGAIPSNVGNDVKPVDAVTPVSGGDTKGTPGTDPKESEVPVKGSDNDPALWQGE